MAIALDTSADLGSSASPLSVAYTCTGSNRLLLVWFYIAGAGDTATGVTYNGIALTQLTKIQIGGQPWIYCYGLLAPATGANTLAISASAGTINGVAVSYTGVLQSGLPDATATNTQAAGPGTLAKAITTVKANCWAATACLNGGSLPTVNTNITNRSNQGVIASGDSNAGVAAGSYTQTWNVNSGSDSEMLQVSFAPVPNTGAMLEVF